MRWCAWSPPAAGVASAAALLLCFSGPALAVRLSGRREKRGVGRGHLSVGPGNSSALYRCDRRTEDGELLVCGTAAAPCCDRISGVCGDGPTFCNCSSCTDHRGMVAPSTVSSASGAQGSCSLDAENVWIPDAACQQSWDDDCEYCCCADARCVVDDKTSCGTARSSPVIEPWLLVLLVCLGLSAVIIASILVAKCVQAWRAKRRPHRVPRSVSGGALAYAPISGAPVTVSSGAVTDDELRRLARLEALRRFGESTSTDLAAGGRAVVVR